MSWWSKWLPGHADDDASIRGDGGVGLQSWLEDKRFDPDAFGGAGSSTLVGRVLNSVDGLVGFRPCVRPQCFGAVLVLVSAQLVALAWPGGELDAPLASCFVCVVWVVDVWYHRRGPCRYWRWGGRLLEKTLS